MEWIGDTGRVGPGDLLALLRAVIRCEQEQQRPSEKQEISFWVPNRFPATRPEQLELAGLSRLRSDSEGLVVTAEPWAPRWLAGANQRPLDSALFAGTVRRSSDFVPADPILRRFGRESYQSAAQRDAVRACAEAPPGSTLIINLPTGAGKSACIHAVIPLIEQRAGTVLVVVPTVALAMDQERALHREIPHPTAYFSGSSAQHRDRNAEIRKRIRTGEQCVVFAAPESCLTTLADCLFSAAANGYLRAVAIDEAHLIDAWGDGFRSSFQELAGLRRSLLERAGCTFPTFLMSATLSQSCIATLVSLFGHPGPTRMVASVQLRPEPDYWFAECVSDEQRIQWVVEVLYHLPRPIILYVTERDQTARWMDHLKDAGFLRCAEMNRATPNDHRRELIDNWRGDRLDVMVATSAFGVGIDHQQVHAVIHACLPESADRYYQEVGRGGRDGRASLSLLLPISRDHSIARRLSSVAIIGLEKGLARWVEMFHAKVPLGTGRFRVPLDAVPAYRAGDITNDYHVMWNARTLTLMCRAGLIALDWELSGRRQMRYAGA